MAGKSSTTTSHPCCEKKNSRAMHHHRLATTNPACSLQLKSPEREPVASQGFRWAVTSVGKKYRKPWPFLGTFLQLQGSFFALKNGRPPNPLLFAVLRCSEYEASNFGAPSSDPNNYISIHVWPVAKICQLGMGQNPVPLVNIKIAGKWMFIPLKMVLIGIDS